MKQLTFKQVALAAPMARTSIFDWTTALTEHCRSSVAIRTGTSRTLWQCASGGASRTHTVRHSPCRSHGFHSHSSAAISACVTQPLLCTIIHWHAAGHRVWMIRNYALLITLPLTIILYMLLYLVPVVRTDPPCATVTDHSAAVAVGWRLSSARVLSRAVQHRSRRGVHRAVQISASHCWSRTHHPQRRSALLVVINKAVLLTSIYNWLHRARLVSVVQNGHAFTAPLFFGHTRECHTTTATAEYASRDAYRDRYQHHARRCND